MKAADGGDTSRKGGSAVIDKTFALFQI